MSMSLPFRRLAATLALALSLGVLAAALLGAPQTLAQTRGPACSSGHAKAKRSAHACTHPSHKRRKHHASKHKTKRGHGKNAKGGASHAKTVVAARCGDGSAPALAEDGSFSCDDGSEPECESGAAPTLASNGKSLVCVLTQEGESGASEECEEQEEDDGPVCSAEQACTPAKEGSSPVCEG